MNPYLIAAAVLAYTLSVGGAYVKGRGDGSELAEAASLREERIATDAREAALRVTADAIQKIEVKNVTIRQTLEKEIRENTIYRECRHTPSGLRDINASLSTGAISPSHSKLPVIDSAR